MNSVENSGEMFHWHLLGVFLEFGKSTTACSLVVKDRRKARPWCIALKGGLLLLVPSPKTSWTSDLFHHVELHLMQAEETVCWLHCCKLIDPL